jgi:uncharacterized membrane protein
VAGRRFADGGPTAPLAAHRGTLRIMQIAPLLTASPVIQLHLACALAALGLAAVQWRIARGSPLHRRIGWIWVMLMVVLSLSSLGIRTVTPHSPWWGYSPIHLLSLWTLFALWRAVRHARRGEVERHRRWMRATVAFALGGAGAFTLLPGRLLHTVLL